MSKHIKKIERSATLFVLLVILLFVVSAVRSSEIQGAGAFIMLESILAGVLFVVFFVRAFVMRVTVRSRLILGKIWVTIWLVVMIVKFFAQSIGFSEFSGYVIAWGIIMTLLRLAIDKHDQAVKK